MKRFGKFSNFKKNAVARLRDAYKNDVHDAHARLEQLSGFSGEELEEVKSVFRYFDRDRNKHLDQEECKCLIKHQIGCNVEDTPFKRIFKKMDLNSDGGISFPEYLKHVANRKKKLPSNYQLHDIFETFDRKENGRINLNEFRNALLYMGEDAGRADLRNIFVHHDDDKDGLISKYEFEDLIRKNFPR